MSGGLNIVDEANQSRLRGVYSVDRNGNPIFAGVDLANRLKVITPVNLFSNKNIHDRNKNQWEEPIIGAIVEHGTVTSGPFQIGETITGGTSGTVGTVTAVNGGSLTITYTVNHDDFVVGETITGGTSGATAVISTVGTGSTITHDRDIGGCVLQVGTSSGDRAVRTTHRYLPYVPGKPQEYGLTFKFGEAKENVRRRVGAFYDDNGPYVEQTWSNGSEEIRVIIRTKITGSVDNTTFSVLKSAWNVDTLDGSNDKNNPSGINLDFSKFKFLIIDYLWQGSGPLALFFDIDGQRILVHKFKFHNALEVPFMSTPSLPVRYEIENTGPTGSVSTMNEYCTAVVSEGGERLTGIGYSISSETIARSVTTNEPVLAVRLKNSFGGGANRKTLRFAEGKVFVKSNEAHFDIEHIHDPTGITATWTDVGAGSAAEFSTDISTITASPGHKLGQGHVAAGTAGKGGETTGVAREETDQHRLLTQNFGSNNSEVFLVSAASLVAQAANIYSTLSWLEFD